MPPDFHGVFGSKNQSELGYNKNALLVIHSVCTLCLKLAHLKAFLNLRVSIMAIKPPFPRDQRGRRWSPLDQCIAGWAEMSVNYPWKWSLIRRYVSSTTTRCRVTYVFATSIVQRTSFFLWGFQLAPELFLACSGEALVVPFLSACACHAMIVQAGSP